MQDTSHYRRFKGYDYSRGASLFVTFSTEPRRELFGRVDGAKVIHSPLGLAASTMLSGIFSNYPGFTLRDHIVMPDHVHLMLSIAPGSSEPMKRLGLAIRGFKRSIAALCHNIGADGAEGCISIWQAGYHDHILTSRAFIAAVCRYIAMNPLKWEMQKNGDRLLRIHEPLFSQRLAGLGYWRGIGNLELLDPGRPLASVRISRRCGATKRTEALLRLRNALDKGYTIASGFISPGEHELREMLLTRADARFIVALPDIMPYGYKPDSRYLKPIAEGRCLIIAHGIEDVDFGREACLDLNDRIAAIAKAGEGVATYWRPDEGPFI